MLVNAIIPRLFYSFTWFSLGVFVMRATIQTPTIPRQFNRDEKRIKAMNFLLSAWP